MVEPLDPTLGSYEALLRAQHADGIVVSGPRFDDEGLARLARDGFPIVLQGSLPGLSCTERRHRQRPRGDAGRRAPGRARLAADRLHHERAACLHRCPATPRRLPGRAGGRRACRTTSASSPMPPSTPAVAIGRWRTSSSAARSTLSSWPATSSPSGRSRRSGNSACASPHDISIVGFDDIALAAYFDPPLTTVRLPAYDLGVAAGTAFSIGSQAGRFRTGRSSRPSSSCGPRRPRQSDRRATGPGP